MAYLDTEKLFDVPDRELLLDRVFGPRRFAKTSETLRAGRLPAEGLAFVARAGGRVVGTLRFWHIRAGRAPALLLGPLAADPAFQSLGIGGLMLRTGLAQATALGHRGVLLVGDSAYYQRFGFDAALTQALTLPGPVERARFLGLNLVANGLAGAEGLVAASGAIPLRRLEPLRALKSVA